MIGVSVYAARRADGPRRLSKFRCAHYLMPPLAAATSIYLKFYAGLFADAGLPSLSLLPPDRACMARRVKIGPAPLNAGLPRDYLSARCDIGEVITRLSPQTSCALSSRRQHGPTLDFVTGRRDNGRRRNSQSPSGQRTSKPSPRAPSVLLPPLVRPNAETRDIATSAIGGDCRRGRY